MIDQTQLSFLPDSLQKELYYKLENGFQAENPYPVKIVRKIKDKFREWEKFKIGTVQGIMKQALGEKKKGSQILQLNR